MTISEAESYTKMLLKQHLPKDYKNWKIEFYYTSRYAGLCVYDRKAIIISLRSLERLSSRQIQEVCQHEVAHAIAFVKFNCRSHNYIWENICKYVVMCPANREVSPDKDFEEARKKDYLAIISYQVKIEIDNYLKTDSKFFIDNNRKFLTGAYEIYRTKFINTKMNSINIFEKVLYYHMLKLTDTSNVYELNHFLKQPLQLYCSKIHKTSILILNDYEINSEYKQEILNVEKHFIQVNFQSIN